MESLVRPVAGLGRLWNQKTVGVPKTMSHPSVRYRIPFNKPGLTGNELRYVADAITLGHCAGDGTYTRRCHAMLEKTLGAARVLLTTSCTHALEMAALLLNIQPGDEVIAPSFTFVSTVNAFVLRGGRPVFIDIRPDTLNLNEAHLESLITPRTRAILPVHYAGVACEMNAIVELAERHGIAVVEDNAHGLFARYKQKYLGTFGCMAAQSFHETKNVICGEGGALVINDPTLVERAEIIREKGTNRSRFFRGQVDKYTWVDIGSSYLPSDILAAFLYAQLEKHAQITATRKRIWTYYYAHLHEWACTNNVQLPHVPAHCKQSYHMFYLVMPSLEARQALIEDLKAHSILSVFHYLPLHLSAMGMQAGGRHGQCPVTERVSDCLLRLPFYNDLSESQQAEIVGVIRQFKVGAI
jgi:dTDP-4-amino-4,6-dideoxygalactose transaminase